MSVRLKASEASQWLKLDSLLVVTGIVSGLIGNYDSPAGEVSKIMPATYSFAIWVPIYLTGFYFALCLERAKAVDFGVGVHLLALSFFMSGLWVRVQSNNSLELLVVFATLILVITQAHLLSKIETKNWKDFLAIKFPSGMLAAWLTLATAVTFSDGLDISFKETKTVAIFAAFAVGFAVCAAGWIVPTLTYRLTLIWGLVGIVIAQHRQAQQVAIVAGVGIGFLLALILRSQVQSSSN